ncbi:MAG: cytochrome c [Sandaracinaceae bacterium]
MRRLTPCWIALTLALGCASQPESYLDFPADETPGGKTDIFGRRLAGVAAPFTPDPSLAENEERLRTDIEYRRQVAWATAHQVLEPVPLLGLAQNEETTEATEVEGEPVPEVPRFETWYGIDDLVRLFQTLYEATTPAERAARVQFSTEAIDQAFVDNSTALDRSRRWPLERYLSYVEALGMCAEGLTEEECARSINSNFSGAAVGNARILYSPGTARHILESYGPIMACLDELGTVTVDRAVTDESNFTFCFEREFPADAVLIKAQWIRADFAMGMPAYDTDAEALTRRMNGAGQWEESGDRRVQPTADEILTIRLRNGDTYRLAGMHIMTKELRHWQWISLFWSDHPDDDFGADRPDGFLEGLDPVWSHYKLCSTVWYTEEDPDPAGRFDESHPSLAAALRAVGAEQGRPTWCSNPYVEQGRNNARTNCIGCHQHGGATVAHDRDGDDVPDAFDLDRVIADDPFFEEFGRTQQREVFISDYLYSFNRVDDFAGMIRRQIQFSDMVDTNSARPRITAILMNDMPDAAAGAEIFGMNCARCHGPEGNGSGFAPNLHDRVPAHSDEELLRSIIQGKGGMPTWGDTFNDIELRNILGFLRETFGEQQL